MGARIIYDVSPDGEAEAEAEAKEMAKGWPIKDKTGFLLYHVERPQPSTVNTHEKGDI